MKRKSLQAEISSILPTVTNYKDSLTQESAKIHTAQKWSFPLRISSVNVTKSQFFCAIRILAVSNYSLYKQLKFYSSVASC